MKAKVDLERMLFFDLVMLFQKRYSIVDKYKSFS